MSLVDAALMTRLLGALGHRSLKVYPIGRPESLAGRLSRFGEVLCDLINDRSGENDGISGGKLAEIVSSGQTSSTLWL